MLLMKMNTIFDTAKFNNNQRDFFVKRLESEACYYDYDCDRRSANDYYSVHVALDTFSVIEPTDYYAHPIEYFTFDILNSIDEPVFSGDVTGDGQLNILDIVQLVNLILS